MKPYFLLLPTLLLTWNAATALEPRGFIEDEQNFLRSALIVEQEPLNLVRRGTLFPIGHGLWTCFDPDLLRYAAIWQVPEGQSPLTLDSMAGVSYPDEKAKADKIPALRGELLASSPELPGVGFNSLPAEDPRQGELLNKPGKVGPLPSEDFRWQGLALRGKDVVLSYRIGDRQILETVRAHSPALIERVISVSSGDKTISLGISGESGKTSGSGARQNALLDGSELSHLKVAGNGKYNISSNATNGIALQIAPNKQASLFRILRSSQEIGKEPEFTGLPEAQPAIPVFPDKVSVTSPAPKSTKAQIASRELKLPSNNPWNRAIRPTDIAFLSNGDALITTLDGDVWRVTDIEKSTSAWTRAGFGIFEPMSIAINKKDEIFVLGRDQITRLEDNNDDGFFDNYLCASDAFRQTAHTRDYATSLEIALDGSFLIARAGLAEFSKLESNENANDRGSILKISADGNSVTTLADGLRVPFIGLRADGAIFSSDQQGNFIPSSPIHLISDDLPFLGYASADFRKKKDPKPPLLWFPYQINRSGSSFATLPKASFPSLAGQFVHLSWSGRIFAIMTPEQSIPFAWKLPVDFDFPILGAATQPTTGKFFAAGIGISGYKPTTPREIGLEEIFEQSPIAAPEKIEVDSDRITVTFQTPLAPGNSVITPRPELDLWNIRRTKNYGSGHFRWDGKPGEHSIPIKELVLSPDRKSAELKIPTIFKSDILRLRIHFNDTVSGNPPYDLEIYARPAHLPEPESADLAAVSKREKAKAVSLVAGESKRGSDLFKNYGCVGCHSLDGTKLTGPPLNGVASRHAQDLDEYLKTSILEPTAFVTEGYEASMPAFAGVIPEQDIEHLVAYLKTLK